MIRALSSRYKSASITCAVSGGDVFKSQSPHIPCGPEEMVAAALGAAQAGAAAVHIHAQEVGTGKPTGILGNDVGFVSVAATGFRMEFRHCAVVLAWGMHCRFGLEDNLRVRRNAAATSNPELVQVAVDLAELLARPLMTPAEFRASLGPWRTSAPAPLADVESR